eukprot:TRINITY_DN23431_c0_g1_i1.p1 TRINITY_DN23431_c0_g1~~TRINITY_DN23431_c0_g1_i1.p1  ORF type:complete len:171 (-),score=23.41 TRINITY_DN23431_c0_g1_i1:194-706(-)
MARTAGVLCETIQTKMWKRETQALPVSSSEAKQGLRRRVSGSSPSRSGSDDSSSSSWVGFIRSRSVAYMGFSESFLQSWWRWGLEFFQSTKKSLFRRMANVRDRDGILGAKDLGSGSLIGGLKNGFSKMVFRSSTAPSQSFRYGSSMSFAKKGARNGEIYQGFANGYGSY